MNPKQFLLIGGVILVLLGIVGFLEGNAKLLGDLLWFDDAENWAHLILGVVALVAAYALPAGIQKPLVVIVGVVALFFAVTGFMVAGRPVPNWYGLTNLENPVDNVLHLVVGVWALYAAFAKPKGMMPGQA